MSSEISFNPGMHNEAELPEEQLTSDNQKALEDLREPQDHSPESLWPSIHQQLEPSPFEKLPPEMKEEIAANLTRQDLSRLSQANRDLRRQFNEAAHKSRNKSQEIEKDARQIQKMNKHQDISSEFAALMTQLSRQRPADQAQDLHNLIASNFIWRPDQAAQLWSSLLKHPIDGQSLMSMAHLAMFSKLPVEKSSGIVNGLLDQIERLISEGKLTGVGEFYLYVHSHPLEVASILVQHMPAGERQAAADRIRRMAKSESRSRPLTDYPLTKLELDLIDLYLSDAGV